MQRTPEPELMEGQEQAFAYAAADFSVGDQALVDRLVQLFPAGLAPGGGSVQEKEKAFLSAIIAKLNDLFTGELSEEDKVVYVGTVIRSKLLESKTLQQQASSNSKEQFSSSPDLVRAQQDAIIDALDAHQSMSSQALNNPDLQKRMLELLLGNFNLWEGLREKAVEETVGS